MEFWSSQDWTSQHKKVVMRPSSVEGVFMVKDVDNRTVAVSRIALWGVSQEDAELIKSGNKDALGRYVQQSTDDPSQYYVDHFEYGDRAALQRETNPEDFMLRRYGHNARLNLRSIVEMVPYRPQAEAA